MVNIYLKKMVEYRDRNKKKRNQQSLIDFATVSTITTNDRPVKVTKQAAEFIKTEESIMS